MVSENCSAVDEIRTLVRDVALGRPIEASRRLRWTSSHLKYLQSESLGPWFHAWLAQRRQSSLPAQIANSLKEDYRQSAYRGMFHETSLREMLRVFQEASIPVVALKGTYLGLCIYRDLAQRPMGDLDLLIRNDQRQQAHDLLCLLGYEIWRPPVDDLEAMVHPSLAYVRKRRVTEYVDLHWGITLMDYYHFPSAMLWDNTMESELHGFKVRFFTPEMNFIHVAVHMLNHGSSPRTCVDLISISRKAHMDWEKLVELADSLHVIRPMYWVLQQLDDEWCFAPPSGVRRKVSSYRPHRMEDRVIQGKLLLFWRWLSRLQLLPDWHARVRYLRNRILPPRSHREAIAGTPSLVRYLLFRSLVLVGAVRKALTG